VKRILKLYSLLFALFIVSCNSPLKEESDETVSVKTAVTVTTPVIKTLTHYIELNAVTQYQRKETIRAITTGYMISLNVLPGQSVNDGDVICQISTKEQKVLQQLDSSSMKAFIKPLSVISSAAGTVTGLNFRSGDFVSEGDVIATIAEPSSLVLMLNVPFEYRSFAQRQTACEVILPDGVKSKGHIEKQLPQVDAASQTQTMTVRINNAPSLPENMNVIVRIPQITKANALCILKSALQTDETQTQFWVMKVVNDSLALKVNVQPGLAEDSLQEIITNQISPNDVIINNGGYGLADSSLVIISK